MRAALSPVLIAMLCCMLPAVAQAERAMVLVTNEICPFTEISTLDIRKAYLGIAVRIDNALVRPHRLNGDTRLRQVFYQSVVVMSEKTYERRLLSLLLKFGTPRPVEYDNVDEMIVALKRTECGIGYMWLSDVGNQDGIKVLKLLWQGD